MAELPSAMPHHDGETYLPRPDKLRLNRQQLAVYEAMKYGAWWTLAALSRATGYPEASISARIRDFRKAKFGGFLVESERVPETRGLWRYRLRISEPQGDLFGFVAKPERTS
jgi:hypothetical protein